jgi:hypothetical protein
MLPGIDPQQRRIFPHHRVLIRIRSDLDLTRLAIFHEPGPARALDAGEGGVEFGFEGGEVAVGGFDCGLHPYTLASSFQLFIYLSSYNVSGIRRRGRYLHSTTWLPPTTILTRCQILPKQSMIHMSAPMEINQRLQCDLCLDILPVFCDLQLFRRSVEAVDVRLMVVLMMQLHDFAADRGLESAIVICTALIKTSWESSCKRGGDGQGRSGRVALPRTKLVEAIAPSFFADAARRAERAAVEVRKSVADIIQLRWVDSFN